MIAEEMQHEAQAVIEREYAWMEAVLGRDAERAVSFTIPEFCLTVAVMGSPLQIISRASCQENFRLYLIHTLKIEDIQARVYGDTAVVRMLWNQQATVFGEDRSATFYLTDIWVKRNGEWLAAERCSSRPEAVPNPNLAGLSGETSK